MHWLALSEEEKRQVIDYCNDNLKKEKPDLFDETGEPIYLDEESNMIDISEIIEGVWKMSLNNQ